MDNKTIAIEKILLANGFKSVLSGESPTGFFLNEENELFLNLVDESTLIWKDSYYTNDQRNELKRLLNQLINNFKKNKVDIVIARNDNIVSLENLKPIDLLVSTNNKKLAQHIIDSFKDYYLTRRQFVRSLTRRQFVRSLMKLLKFPESEFKYFEGNIVRNFEIYPSFDFQTGEFSIKLRRLVTEGTNEKYVEKMEYETLTTLKGVKLSKLMNTQDTGIAKSLFSKFTNEEVKRFNVVNSLLLTEDKGLLIRSLIVQDYEELASDNTAKRYIRVNEDGTLNSSDFNKLRDDFEKIVSTMKMKRFFS